MDKSEIIALMLAARHEPGVRNLPEFEEAEQRLASSDGLRRELEREEAYYDAHPDLLSGVQLPEAARRRIVDSLRDAQAAADRGPAGAIPFAWRPLALAAALVILVAGLVAVLHRPSGGSPFQDLQVFLAEQVAGGIGPLDHTDPTAAPLLAWLDSAGAPSTDRLDQGLARLQSMGCKVLERNGREISLICFKTGDNKLLHLFITRMEGLDPDDVDACCGRHDHAQRETLTWHDSDQAYFLVAHDVAQGLDGLSLSG